MKCHSCGADLREIETDLPFKLNQKAIVIIKQMPVLQCENCREYLIEDPVMEKVEKILEAAGDKSELEVVSYAA